MSVNLSGHPSDLEVIFPHPTARHGHKFKAIWKDDDNVIHRAVGAEVHRGVRLMWTACEKKDIPANEAWLQREGEAILCDACLEEEKSYGRRSHKR